MKNPLHEIRLFMSYPRNMRVLLITNLIFAFNGPVIGLFVGAYLMRKSDNDVKVPITYQLMQYVGIPITFLVNGWLLRAVPVAWLYSLGMLISGVSIAWMMSLSQLSLAGIAIAGLLMGMASGLYWSNRDFLAVASTNDGNRNYYYGLESFLGTSVGIGMPVLIGAFIHWFIGRGAEAGAYRILAGGVFVVSLVASAVVNQGHFKNPPQTKFVYFRFHPLWMRLQALAAIKGLSSGYTVMVPAILTMIFLKGKEGSLGVIQSSGQLLTAVLLYVIGRIAKPKHRIPMYIAGMGLYAIATIPNALVFNQFAALWFMIFLLLAQPLADMADTTVQMLTIDTVSAIEGRSMYAYILNREFGYFVGRAGGLIIFLILAYGISNTAALRYALLIIGFVQLSTIWVIRSLVKGCAKYAPAIPQPSVLEEIAGALREAGIGNPPSEVLPARSFTT
jgi:MFS transporter, YQGE family, putative transporter